MTESIQLSNELIKEAFTDALAYRGQISNLDAEDIQTGFYRLYNPAGRPIDNLYGFLIHLQPLPAARLQIVISRYSGIYYRVKWDSWSAWKKVTDTSVT